MVTSLQLVLNYNKILVNILKTLEDTKFSNLQ